MTTAAPLTVLETLQQTRELLSKPQRWTRGTLARDSRGLPVSPESPRACRFCVMGALYRVTNSPTRDYTGAPDPVRAVYDALLRQMPLDEHDRPAIYPSVVNDVQGRGAVLSLLDRAIIKEQQR
jgi:hypothetical protein